MNIGLAIDKHNGVESEVVGVKEHCKKDFHNSNLYAQDEANKNNTKCFGYGTEILKKAQNEWSGWGSCLKPAYEPIIVARKPVEGTIVENVLKYGVGGLNIDECRVPFVNDTDYNITANKNQHEDFGTKPMTNNNVYGDYSMIKPKNYSSTGRFPANVITDGSDEVAKGFPNTKGNETKEKGDFGFCFDTTKRSNRPMGDGYNDEGSAMRYFYCAKASRRDRDDGLSEFEDKQMYMLNDNTPNDIIEEINRLLSQ